MIVILTITMILIILYLLYPLFLLALPKYFHTKNNEPGGRKAVSLILLTYNGMEYIDEKVRQLAEELELIDESEFIIVDDYSTDGSRELLESLNDRYNFTLILKNEQKGIPHSMNLGVNMARYDYVIFSDQRQKIKPGSVRELVLPLADDEVGAVSAYISCHDKSNHISLLRKHENLLKKWESRTGYLIGVYGPLYAVRKSCYREVADPIILDDLYLSLKILSEKKIVLVKDCLLVDDTFSSHYNFIRSKRYLHGLLQILFKRDLVSHLPFRVMIMLLWHKYLRLLIPPLAVLSYLSAARYSLHSTIAMVIFTGITSLVIISLLARQMNIFSNLDTFFRINAYYFVSIIYVAIQRIFNKVAVLYRAKK